MATINQQDVLKAFYQFDCAGIVLTKLDGRAVAVVDQKNPKLRMELAKIWLDLFDGLDKDIWAKAVDIALAESKVYPDDAQMLEYVVRAEVGDTPKAAPAPAAPTTAAKRLSNTERMAEMFRRAKAGDFAGALQLCRSDYTADEIICFAREHWHDVDDAWIDKNYRELRQLLLQQKSCDKCMSLHGCQWRGMRSKGVIDKYSGCLNLVAEECPLRRPKSNEVQ